MLAVVHIYTSLILHLPFFKSDVEIKIISPFSLPTSVRPDLDP
jgi:hypothetical protein